MSNLKIIGLTLFLTIGFIFPSCVEDSCDGVVFRNYFDIFDIGISSYTDYQNRTTTISNDTIPFSELDRIYIDYLVDYVAASQPKHNWSFSLMPTANACTYVPGGNGSKTESLVNFSIITLNDFDATHPANSTINDLFEYHGSYYNSIDTPIPLPDFLDGLIGNIESEDMVLELTKAPELNEEFKVKVIMELSTGEIFEVISEPFFITN